MTKDYIIKRLEKKGYKVTEDYQTGGVIVIANSFPFPFRSLSDAWSYFKNK